MRRLLGLAAVLIVLVVLSWTRGSAEARAQTPGVADRAPQFYLASANSRVLSDASDVPALRRRIAVHLDRAPLSEALETIATKARLRLVYAPDILPRVARVSLVAEDITVTAALTEALLDTGLDVIISSVGQMTLVKRQRQPVSPAGTVVGRVSQHAGGGIAGVDVALEGTRWRTTTDSSGRYRLASVEVGAYMITFRRIGFAKSSRPVTVVADREDTVDVALDARPTRLNELVSTATGPQRRLDIANDITTLHADSIVRTQPINSVTDLLEGRVPGSTVQHTSGAPGDPSRLRLQGASSPLRNNDPIVIVDGVRVYAQQSDARSANLAPSTTPYATTSPLDYIDPNSIETVEIVKGPSAATLYGQDAANGVIVITTKKGKPGPARWDISGEHGRREMAGNYPDLWVRWGHPLYDDTPVLCPIDDVTNNGTFGSATTKCQADSVVHFQMLNDPALTVLGHGAHTRGSLGVSGGSGSLTYSVIGTLDDDLGLVKLPDYEIGRYRAIEGLDPPDWLQRPQNFRQWNVTSTITALLGGKAQLSLHTDVMRLRQQKSDLADQLGGLAGTYLDKASGKYYQGASSGVASYTAIIPTDALLFDYYQRVRATATSFTGGADVAWPVRDWLRVTANAGLNVTGRADEIYLPRSQIVGQDSLGRLGAATGTSVETTVGLRANTNVPLGLGFRLGFATGVNYVGTSIRDLKNETTSLVAGQIAPGVDRTVADQSTQDDATFGFYVEPGISHPRFNFTTGLRFDGGKSYGQKVTLPTFPKLGFSYLLSEESWYPLKTIVPLLKVRIAYGRASRQPGPADRLRLYTDRRPDVVDGLPVTVTTLDLLGNRDLRPERETGLDGGFDAEMLDSRLVWSLSLYRKTTDDALLRVPVAPSVYGAQTIFKNIGVIRNTGVNVSLDAQMVRSAAFTWNGGLQVTRNRNVVVRLGPGVLPFYTDGSSNSSGLRVAPGYPLFGRWTKPILGYSDANGNGLLETSEVLFGDTAVYVGQTEPNYQVTFHTVLSFWRSFSLSADLAYDNGLSQVNAALQAYWPFTRGRNDVSASLPEQLAVVPQDINNSSEYNWIQTVSTTRLNQVSLSYNAPQSLARRFGAQGLRLSVQSSNVAVWTNYSGLDPNVNSNPTGNDVRDPGVLPRPRIWQVRVNVNY